jgi:hypothetical protein
VQYGSRELLDVTVMLLLRDDLQERRCRDEADWQNAGGKARLSRPTGFGGGPAVQLTPSGHGLGAECPDLAFKLDKFCQETTVLERMSR